MKLNVSMLLLALVVGCGGDTEPEVENQGVIKRLDASDPNGCWVTPKVGDGYVDADGLALFANQAEGEATIPFESNKNSGRFYIFLAEPWVRQQLVKIEVDVTTNPHTERQFKSYFQQPILLLSPSQVGGGDNYGFSTPNAGGGLSFSGKHSTAPWLDLTKGYTPEGLRMSFNTNLAEISQWGNGDRGGSSVFLNGIEGTGGMRNDQHESYSAITTNESINAIAGLQCFQGWIAVGGQARKVRMGGIRSCLYKKPGNGNWIYFAVPFRLDQKPEQVTAWLQLLIQHTLADKNAVEFTQLFYSPPLDYQGKLAYESKLRIWVKQRMRSIYLDCDPQASYDAGKLLPRQPH